MHMTAAFSKDRRFRYELRRQWDASKPWVNFIGLNPSVADGQTDDPTIRRCIGFARAWGYGGLIMTNLFPLVASRPAQVVAAFWQSRGQMAGLPENGAYLLDGVQSAGLVVGAWGEAPDVLWREQAVQAQLRLLVDAGAQFHALTVLKGGQPGHPLYLKADLTPRLYQPLLD